MTVAISVAAVLHRAVRMVKRAIGRVAQRLYIERGAMKTETKHPQAPAMKRANIQRLASRTRSRASVIEEGRAIVAPASSSDRMISTGLNQYRASGCEQSVTSSP